MLFPACDGSQKFVTMFTRDQMIQAKDMGIVEHYVHILVLENQISNVVAVSKWLL
jgi:hypothetical protein